MNTEDKKSPIPQITIGVVFVLIVIVIFYWLSRSSDESSSVIPEPEIAVEFVPEPIPSDMLPEPVSEPVIEEAPPPVVVPEPVDISDGAVKTKILELSNFESFGRLLVDEGVLQRFVVMTTGLANKEVTANHQVLIAPDKPFRTYQQADKEWIDPASYKRYTPYVEVLESIETDSILAVYAVYKVAIENIFSEISNPNGNFDDTLMRAIDLLLDTPEVPVPVEVHSDSVMYKFSDEQLESLSAPQKQLLRTGPENMRRIKAKLREIKLVL